MKPIKVKDKGLLELVARAAAYGQTIEILSYKRYMIGQMFWKEAMKQHGLDPKKIHVFCHEDKTIREKNESEA